MSLWQELESLQKKKAELNSQLLSVAEKEQNSLERIVIFTERIEIQEEYMHELEVQLNDKYDAVSKLESRIAELEKTLKDPMKEPAREKPENQSIEMSAPALEKQHIEMTVQTTAALVPKKLTFWQLVALGLDLQ